MLIHSTRVLVLALLFAIPAAGQVKQKEKEKEKEKDTVATSAMATDVMKKSDVKSPSVVETVNLILAAAIPEAKAKTVAASLQKTFELAAKALKFDEADLKSRVIVYAFSEVDQFQQFQRSVLKQRPDPDEYAIADMKRDIPFIAVSPRRGDKNPNYDAMVANELCRSMLVKKGGNARIPGWMKDGFARAVQMRGNPTTVGTDRSTVQRMAPPLRKGAKGASVANKAWTDGGKDHDLVAASLMDFMAFGPGAEKLGSILNGLVPEGNNTPTFAQALMGADWMLEDLDRAWRDWIAKGSPVGSTNPPKK